MQSASNVTVLLQRWKQGDQDALDTLVPLVHNELRSIARRCLSNRQKNHTLCTTALINEAFVHRLEYPEVEWQNRTHFFAVSARIMRNILVDYARGQLAAKRGGGYQRLSLDDVGRITVENIGDLVSLEDALALLSQADCRKGKIVELRYFGGLAIDETAAVLGISPATVKREWKLARNWLYMQLLRN